MPLLVADKLEHERLRVKLVAAIYPIVFMSLRNIINPIGLHWAQFKCGFLLSHIIAIEEEILSFEFLSFVSIHILRKYCSPPKLLAGPGPGDKISSQGPGCLDLCCSLGI